MNEAQINTEIEAIHHSFVEKNLDNMPKGSPSLYHYTSLDSAQKIIRSGVLRLTNMRYLNDPSEVENALSILNEVSDELVSKYRQQGENEFAKLISTINIFIHLSLSPTSKRTGTKEAIIDKLNQEYGDDTTSFAKLINSDTRWSLYITSFSEKSDDLRQWIPYGDNCKGAALGFEGIDKETNQHNIANTHIIRVSYSSDEKKKEFLCNFYREIKKWYEKNIPHTLNVVETTNRQSILINQLIHLLLADLVGCKREEYSDEKEWRLFVFINHDRLRAGEIDYPQFITKDNLLKPYYEIPLNPDVLIDIKLGSLNNELNHDSLDLLLKSKSIKNCKISHSGIPYRG